MKAAFAGLIGAFICCIFPSFLCHAIAQHEIRDRAVLDSIISITSQRSVYREEVDWTVLRDSMNAIHDTSGLITAARHMLKQLGDFHGAIYYRGAPHQGCYRDWVPTRMDEDSAIFAAARNGTLTIHAEILPGKIGYIRVPGVAMDEEEWEYVREMRKAVVEVRSKIKPLGWIIDLRLNGGGSMYPMLAGLADFFGRDTLGFFTGSTPESWIPWSVQNGEVAIGGEVTSQYGFDKHMDFSQSPVAVLISAYTASSGEVLVTSFHGRPSTILIGEPTAGYTTANVWYTLTDELALNIAEGYYADRNRNVFPGTSIEPDIHVSGGDQFNNLISDKKVQKALKWLEKQNVKK